MQQDQVHPGPPIARVFVEHRPAARMALREPIVADSRPLLRVITTPPELRARWQRGRAIRRVLLLALAIGAALVAFGMLV